MASDPKFSDWYFAFSKEHNRTPSQEEVWKGALASREEAPATPQAEPVVRSVTAEEDGVLRNAILSSSEIVARGRLAAPGAAIAAREQDSNSDCVLVRKAEFEACKTALEKYTQAPSDYHMSVLVMRDALRKLLASRESPAASSSTDAAPAVDAGEVLAWAIPKSHQFSWDQQDERYWTPLVPAPFWQPAPPASGEKA